MWTSPARCMERGKGTEKPCYLFIYWKQCMGDTQKASEPWKKTTKHLRTQTRTRRMRQQPWPLHWEEGEQKERKKTQKSHASTKPVDYCSSFLLHRGQIFYWQPCSIKASCWLCSWNILFLAMGKQVSKINQYCHSETICPKFIKGKGNRNEICLLKKCMSTSLF